MTEVSSSLIPDLDRQMVSGLQAFYELASRQWKDVRGECSGIARQVAKQFGLLYVEGQFRLDAPMQVGNTKLFEAHAWCVDGKRKVVDLTAEQFNPGLMKKVPKGVLIVGEDDEMYVRYQQTRIVRRP